MLGQMAETSTAWLLVPALTLVLALKTENKSITIGYISKQARSSLIVDIHHAEIIQTLTWMHTSTHTFSATVKNQFKDIHRNTHSLYLSCHCICASVLRFRHKPFQVIFYLGTQMSITSYVSSMGLQPSINQSLSNDDHRPGKHL